MEKLANVRIFSHHFSVERVQPRAVSALHRFSARNGQYGTVRGQNGFFHRTLTKVFAAASRRRTFFRYHINQLDKFKEHLLSSNFSLEQFEFIDEPLPTEVRKSRLKIRDGWAPRDDNQKRAIEHIKRAGLPRSRLLELQTGKGKSYCFLQAAVDIGTLPVLFIRPSYIEKWIIDIMKTCDVDEDRIISVEGSHELQILLDKAKDPDFDPAIILISNKTYQNYLKLYEEREEAILEEGYGCTPPDFFQHIGAGIRCIDEGHQDYHLNFKLDLYSNVELAVTLTATLISKDAFMQSMYELGYPPNTRIPISDYDKYVSTYAIGYHMREPERVRVSEWGSKNYSHTAFEKSILKNAKLKSKYFELIERVIDNVHFNDYEPGNKLAIYCATIDMCEQLSEYLKEIYHDKTCEKYTQGDPYDNLMKPDIRVTTLGKAGAAVDIPGLKTTILTVSVDSIQSNLQVFGRTRRMDSGQVPVFAWIYCRQLKKQVEYHNSRLRVLGERSMRLKDIEYGFCM